MTSAVYEHLRYEARDRKAYVTINRPEAMNAINRRLRESITDLFAEIAADNGVLAVILTGEGGRAFSAGADLKEMAALAAATDGHAPAPTPRPGYFRAVFDAVDQCPKPVIAAIDGYCLAGGFELALMCDIRLATEKSVFGLPEPRRSLLAGPGLINLSRMIPLGEALHLQLTGKHLPAKRAYQIGLIQGLLADRPALMDAAEEIANEVLECAPLAVQYIKQVVKVGRNLPIEYAWKYSEMFSAAIARTEDAQEGRRAFVEKRKPNWNVR